MLLNFHYRNWSKVFYQRFIRLRISDNLHFWCGSGKQQYWIATRCVGVYFIGCCCYFWLLSRMQFQCLPSWACFAHWLCGKWTRKKRTTRVRSKSWCPWIIIAFVLSFIQFIDAYSDEIRLCSWIFSDEIVRIIVVKYLNGNQSMTHCSRSFTIVSNIHTQKMKWPPKNSRMNTATWAK